MIPRLSKIGDRMSQLTGVRAIMKDIIETLADTNVRWINLSAGNPVILPEIEQMWRDYTAELLVEDSFGETLCRYGSSQGYEPFIEAVVDYFQREFGWNLSPRHVLACGNGSNLVDIPSIHHISAGIAGTRKQDCANALID